MLSRSSALLLAFVFTLNAPGLAAATRCKAEPSFQSASPASAAAAIRELARHKVTVEDICRDARGWRFYAAFAADPQTGPNAHFYNALFFKLTQVLHARHLTLINRPDGVAITIDRGAGRELRLGYASWQPRS